MESDGQITDERFGMVVLSVGTQPPALAIATAEALGIELNPYGFCETDKFTPLQTSQPGVYVCGTFQSPKEIAETIIDASGAAGDRWSMGFLVETERQVEKHIDGHIGQLPADDARSRAILEQMRTDEIAHADSGRALEGEDLPAPMRGAMRLMAKVMTETAYRF